VMKIYILELPGILILPVVIVAHSEYEARHIQYNYDIDMGIMGKALYFSNRAHRWLEEAICKQFIPDTNGVGIVVK
jgi:hypothetical protein